MVPQKSSAPQSSYLQVSLEQRAAKWSVAKPVKTSKTSQKMKNSQKQQEQSKTVKNSQKQSKTVKNSQKQSKTEARPGGRLKMKLLFVGPKPEKFWCAEHQLLWSLLSFTVSACTALHSKSNTLGFCPFVLFVLLSFTVSAWIALHSKSNTLGFYPFVLFVLLYFTVSACTALHSKSNALGFCPFVLHSISLNCTTQQKHYILHYKSRNSSSRGKCTKLKKQGVWMMAGPQRDI